MLPHTPQCPPTLRQTPPPTHTHPQMHALALPRFPSISSSSHPVSFIFPCKSFSHISLLLSSIPEVVNRMEERSAGSIFESTGCRCCCCCKGMPKQAVRGFCCCFALFPPLFPDTICSSENQLVSGPTFVLGTPGLPN